MLLPLLQPATAAGAILMGIVEPHYNESYYLLATHVTEEDIV